MASHSAHVVRKQRMDPKSCFQWPTSSSSSKALGPKHSIAFKIALLAGDQVFQHKSPGGIFHIKNTTAYLHFLMIHCLPVHYQNIQPSIYPSTQHPSKYTLKYHYLLHHKVSMHLLIYLLVCLFTNPLICSQPIHSVHLSICLSIYTSILSPIYPPILLSILHFIY